MVCHVGQLPALSRTIRRAPESFGPLIKSLTILYIIPHHFKTVALDSLTYILQHAPMLRTLSIQNADVWSEILHDKFYLACTDPYIGCQPIIAALQAQSTHVTTLEFFTSPSLSNILESVSPLDVLPLFHTFGNIQSLSLDRVTWNTLDWYEELELPQVKSLCIWDSIARILQPPAFPPWKMPKLNKLKLQCVLPEAASTRAFFDMHGVKITQLYLPFIPIDASLLKYIVG